MSHLFLLFIFKQHPTSLLPATTSSSTTSSLDTRQEEVEENETDEGVVEGLDTTGKIFEHATRAAKNGLRQVYQVMCRGKFNKQATIDGLGSATLLTSGVKFDEAQKVYDDTLTDIVRTELIDTLLLNLYAIKIPERLLGLIVGYGSQIEVRHVTSNWEDIFGPHGRNRFEGRVEEPEITDAMRVFIESQHRNFVSFTTPLYFRYYSNQVLQAAISRTKARIEVLEEQQHKTTSSISTNTMTSSFAISSSPSLSSSSSASSAATSGVSETELEKLRASLAILEESATKAQRIKIHHDTRDSRGRRKFKALFNYNYTGEESVYDFYYQGIHICTICVPSGHCLFASDIGLGMFEIRQR